MQAVKATLTFDFITILNHMLLAMKIALYLCRGTTKADMVNAKFCVLEETLADIW